MTSHDISDFELFLNRKQLEILRELSLKEITEINVREITRLIDKLLIYFIYGKDKSSWDRLFRLTINKAVLGTNTRITNIKYLKYPPKNLVKRYGRCNLPQQSVLYASLMSMTALDEMRPRAGDLITETVWKRKSDKRLTYIPIFSNQPTNQPMVNPVTGEVIPFLTNVRTLEMEAKFREKLSNHPKNLQELSLSVVQFIADCFSKPVNSENHFNYVFSAFIADKFLYKVEGDEIDALYYPSVANKLNSENLAIKPNVFDDLYEPFGVVENMVISDPSTGGGYYMKPSGATTKFNFDTDEILWDEERTSEELFLILDSH